MLQYRTFCGTSQIVRRRRRRLQRPVAFATTLIFLPPTRLLFTWTDLVLEFCITTFEISSSCRFLLVVVVVLFAFIVDAPLGGATIKRS